MGACVPPPLAEHISSPTVAKQARRSGRLRIGMAVVAVLVVGAVLQAGSPLLRRAGLVTVPQRYVALYFSHPTDLPSHLGPGHHLSFGFGVSNYTGSAIKQRWRVSAVTVSGKARLLRTGTLAVPAGSARTVGVSVSLPAGVVPARVEVSLPSRHLAPVEFHLRPVPNPRRPVHARAHTAGANRARATHARATHTGATHARAARSVHGRATHLGSAHAVGGTR